MNRNNGIFIYAAAMLSMALWGMSFVWSTIVFRYYSPITTVFLRLIISFVLLYTGTQLFGNSEKIKSEDYRLFLLSALFNPFLYFLGESYGLKMSSSTISAVIIATIPLFTPVVSYFTLKEKPTWLNILGIIVSFSGIILMVINDKFQMSASPAGIFLLMFAVATAITYTIFLKKLSAKYSAIKIITVQNLIGAVYFLPLFLILDLDHFFSVMPDLKLMGSLLSLAVFCSSVAYILFTIALKEIGVNKTNIFTNLIPVFTGVFSFFLLGEEFNLQKISGMAIVIIGLYLSQIKKSSPVINYG
ncbi:MAG: DMT family transporter [Bacteroidetes bacterium]|nr:DMT family transporter [Bacteroidota bacterium]